MTTVPATRTRLVVPDVRLERSWIETVLEFGPDPMHGSGTWDLPQDADGLAAWVAPPRCTQVVAHLREQADRSVVLPDDRVHCDYFWMVDPDDDELVGFIAVRHELNDFLREIGGHIGYSVRPSRRRRGHASRALALAVVRARELGLDRALVTCDLDNRASAATIERCGGVLEDVRGDKRRYWIATGTRE